MIQGKADAYTDLSSLDRLRAQARNTPNDAVDKVAKQFEGMFLNMVLKSMREASLGEGLFASSAEETHQSMYDQQLALEISAGEGLGFAKALRTQLGQVAGITPKVDGELAVSATALVNRAAIPRFHGVVDSPNAEADIASASAPMAASGDNARFDTPQAFVDRLWPAARKAATRLGVQPEVLLAQAAHETGWGRHVPQRPDGESSYNLFGIKAGRSWQGERVSKDTFEVVNGVPEVQRAQFRAYDSFEASLEDYAELIGGRDRYASAVRDAASPEGYLNGLQQGGYATDPAYAERVLAVLNSARFQQALPPQNTPVQNLTSVSGMEPADSPAVESNRAVLAPLSGDPARDS
ncbi:MAG: flagellar assembly peptidoglycan hydrolase FlgJ [Gammaproteobacteria bacterium]|nr:flagellar assembly peptidoglycan hydrolase FlgJ [Gammaproteobacteria bacterium]